MHTHFFRKEFTLQARRHNLLLGRQTKIMGILNLSPDSFSHDGISAKNKKNIPRIISIVQTFIHQGCDILDVGAESTRPGSVSISPAEEIKRLIPVICALSKKIKIPISVDTTKPLVAQHALDNGASIINNIKGLQFNRSLFKMIGRYDAAVVLMHMRGTPDTMQKNIRYKNFLKEIILELNQSIEKCLEIGIKSDRITIDPGIGFGKIPLQNFELIHRLKDLQVLNCPVLVGPSRKSFIGWILEKDVSKRLMGTAAAVCASILNGAHIVRVHDVGKMKDVALTADAILNSGKIQNKTSVT